MTTFHVGTESQELADAIGAAIPRADLDAIAPLSEMRNAAQPGNGWPGPAAVPWGVRGSVARALRAVADEGHPLSDQLRGLADGLDNSIRSHVMNNPHLRHLAPPDPAAEPAPTGQGY